LPGEFSSFAFARVKRWICSSSFADWILLLMGWRVGMLATFRRAAYFCCKGLRLVSLKSSFTVRFVKSATNGACALGRGDDFQIRPNCH